MRLDHHAGPLATLTRLPREASPDWPQILERIRGKCGSNLPTLADVLGFSMKRFLRIAEGDTEPTWSEGQLILRAAEVIARNSA